MGHVPIKELVHEARQLSTRCMRRAQKLREHNDPTSAQEWEEVAGELANHADHVESLLNDYRGAEVP